MISQRHTALLLIFCLFGGLGIFQDLEANEGQSKHIRFSHLSESGQFGLQSDQVHDIVDDNEGNVWIATSEGLARFNYWRATKIPNVTNPDTKRPISTITALAIGSKKNSPLWMGTPQGLLRKDPTSSAITRISKSQGHPLSSDHITDLAISDDSILWIATNQGLHMMTLETGKIVSVPGELGNEAITFVKNHASMDVWVGTRSGKLFQFDTNDQTFKERWKTSVPITCIALGNNNQLWIGTDGRGLFRKDFPQSKEIEKVDIGSRTITAIHQDSDIKSNRHDLWVGTSDGLAVIFNADKTTAWFKHSPHHKESLAHNHITAISQDGEILWIGTASGGTSRFNLSEKWFTHIRSNLNQAHGLPDAVISCSATAPDGNIWFGTRRGLSCWDPKTLSFKPLPIALAKDKSWFSLILWDDQGNQWLGKRGDGLIRLSPSGERTEFKHRTNLPHSIGHDNISTGLKRRDGSLYFGTLGSGLFRFDPETESFTRIRNQEENAGNQIRTITEDEKDNLWVATEASISILPQGADELIPFHQHFPGAPRFNDSDATAIFHDFNSITWIGTAHSGLLKFNATLGKIDPIDRAFHGLADNHVMSILKDTNDNLWLATKTSIARLSDRHNQLRPFTEKNGLQSHGFTPNTAIKADNGSLYFGGMDGFNIIETNSLPSAPDSPIPILESLYYFAQEVKPKKDGILEKPLAATNRFGLPFDERSRFSINFGPADRVSTDDLYFRYQLSPYDSEWLDGTEDRRATYIGVPSGDYTFQVQVSQDGQKWFPNRAKVNINIIPPWWETLWFRATALLSLLCFTILLTHGIIRSRIKVLQRRQQNITAQRDKAEAALVVRKV